MKKWVSPELKELKASWTKELLFAPGVDSYVEESILPDGTPVELGSCH